MRHLGWLHASPDGGKGTRHDDLSRRGSSLTQLPEIEEGEHVLQWLFEVGPSSSTAVGPGPISFSEIAAWASITQTRITSEEALLIRALSRDYCAEYHGSSKSNTVPPYSKEAHRVGAGIMAAFQGYKEKLNG